MELMTRKHLVIPDAHAKPGESLRRFEWLGELIMQEMPDVIIDIGDWYDMESLCVYDKGTKTAEGRSYKDDIEAGREAERLSFGRILDYNNKMTRSKKKKYNPTIIRTMGNHEAPRIKRYLEKNPEMDAVSTRDVISPMGGDLDMRTFDFLSPAITDGIAYSHYFVSGIMGRPITGAHLLLSKKMMSCTMGHSHLRDWAEGMRIDGTRMQGLICGSFHDPDHDSTYADTQAQGLWWNGLHIKNDVDQGNYDRTEVSVKRLQKMMEG